MLWSKWFKKYTLVVVRSMLQLALLGAISCAAAQPGLDLTAAQVPLAAGTVVDSNINANNMRPKQQKLFQRALQEVLVKLTGNPGVMSLPAVRQQFPQAMPWVSSYSTVQRQLGGHTYNYLQVQFNAAGLRQGLRAAQQPLWPVKRPATLVYLILGHGDNVRVLTSSSHSPVLSLIGFAAELRGVPIVLPQQADALIDASILAQPGGLSLTASQLSALCKQFGVQHVMLGSIDPAPALLPLAVEQGSAAGAASEDSAAANHSAAVSAATVTSTATPPVVDAAPNVLAANAPAKLDLSANAARASAWWLGDAEQNTAWSQPSMPLWNLLQQAVGSLANMLSNQSVAAAAEAGSVSPVTVMVSGVDALRQYQQVTNEFLHANAISGVQLLGVTAHGVRLRLNVAGGVGTVLQIMQNNAAQLPNLSLQADAATAAGNIPSHASGNAPNKPASAEHDIGGQVPGQLGCGADICLQWK